MPEQYYFDCSECDYHTEDIAILDNLSYDENGDAICPECKCSGVVYDLRESQISDNIVAAPQAGAVEINSTQLSDNGPAHQIAVLPLAGSPSDNTSHAKMSVTPDSDIPSQVDPKISAWDSNGDLM